MNKILAAMIMLMSCSFAHAVTPLGRLFFTPEERQAFEQRRLNKNAPVVQSAGDVTINGIIQKHGAGTTTVWINNKLQSDPVSTGKNAKAQATIPFPIPATGQAIDVKVGQTLDIDSGKIVEGYRIRKQKKLLKDPVANDSEIKPAQSPDANVP